MRIKVGDHWFEAEPGQPVMVELNASDRRNIANMHVDATRYAEFHDDCIPTVAERGRWMDEGARPQGPLSSLVK